MPAGETNNQQSVASIKAPAASGREPEVRKAERSKRCT
jgi:hypothetical protein